MHAWTMRSARRLGVVLGIAALVACLPCRGVARAEDSAQVDRVEILDAGEFEELSQGVGVRDYGEACPALDVRLLRPGEAIEAAPMVRFGFTFAAIGPRPGELVPLKVRVRKPREYGSHGENTWTLLACTGSPAFAGWRCPQDAGIEAGVWVVEVLYQGEIMASRSFDVHPLPDFALAVPQAEGYEEPGELRTRIGPAEHVAGGGPVGPSGGGPVGPSTWTLAQGDSGVCVQVSACLIPENATNDVAALGAKGYPVFLKVVEDGARGRTWHTVRLGYFPTRSEAERASREFQELEHRPAFVIGR